jgi:hypothetical protein
MFFKPGTVYCLEGIWNDEDGFPKDMGALLFKLLM